MMLSAEAFFSKIPLRHIWVFVTEKCNLSCDYCFFTDRGRGNDIRLSQFRTILKSLDPRTARSFVISGGEPLLRWGLIKRMIGLIRKSYPEATIDLQTNMLLLGSERIDFICRNNVLLECGLDGDFFVNRKHRKGFTRNTFERCLAHIKSALRQKIKIHPTMTVHPSETRSMFDNFKVLAESGLSSIEAHPAFFKGWERGPRAEFLRQYKKILKFERISGRHLVCKSYSAPGAFGMDLVVEPDGFILPNWTFLKFPKVHRKEFYLFKAGDSVLTVFKENLLRYLKEAAVFLKKEKSYREFSNFNAEMILENAGGRFLKKQFLAYRHLCREIESLDRNG